MNDWTVRLAASDDCEAAFRILDGAARWLAGIGINQWAVPYPRHLVENWIALGTLHVGKIDGLTVGTIRLTNEDAELWDDAGPSLYVHSLAVAREHAGRGVGVLLLEYANHVALERGVDSVRLDCWSENHALREYYERNQFVHVRDVRQCTVTGGVENPVRREWYSSLFEKPACA